MLEDADWDRLIDQLSTGDCTPFLGAGACAGSLPTGAELSREFAGRYHYPFTDAANLPRVMDYIESVVRDPVTLKRRVVEYLRSYVPPSSVDPPACDPHAVLAKFPISTFLTTNYDNLLETALRAEAKNPYVETADWWNVGQREQPDLAEPSKDEPLIYHLHGSWAKPASLVLTETDYMTYMANIVDTQASNLKFALPGPVLDAMSTTPLLFIGYSLQDWNFRVIFHGLARTIPKINQRRHVSVQLLPKLKRATLAHKAQATNYVGYHLNGWNISVFLGTAEEFCAELQRRMGTT